ncbi:hypothetical protein [Aquifex aeolicus]|uniref:hypothetical protein n=1 Tax=Aquifex aeolicus TaxID=63363 RepID=UPI0002D41A9D|nr:hypothetical protein [Aquifex aeolicus]
MTINEKEIEKLKKLAKELEDLPVGVDIDLEVCFDDVVKEEGCEVDLTPGYKPQYPYVKIVYKTGDGDLFEKKIEIPPEILKKDIKEIKEFVTFAIEQFMEEIDSVEYGGE